VAELEGTAVGFVTCFVHSAIPAGEIGNNAVHPAYQGRGFAPRLYERAFDWLREKGMEYARVTTGGDPAHAPARRAYEKAGFDVPLPVVQYYREL
jgi:GNAT superfamily N-acetyltransferase